MTLFATIRNYLKTRPRAWWDLFDVTFDDTGVVIRESHWWRRRVDERRFHWANIRSVCFKDCGLSSDVFLIYTSEREEAFMVPTEAHGGLAFWQALSARGLFPEEISQAAVKATDGGSYWWPRDHQR
jgi:hypothetical protein